jgi:hypothetical protein
MKQQDSGRRSALISNDRVGMMRRAATRSFLVLGVMFSLAATHTGLRTCNAHESVEIGRFFAQPLGAGRFRVAGHIATPAVPWNEYGVFVSLWSDEPAMSNDEADTRDNGCTYQLRFEHELGIDETVDRPRYERLNLSRVPRAGVCQAKRRGGCIGVERAVDLLGWSRYQVRGDVTCPSEAKIRSAVVLVGQDLEYPYLPMIGTLLVFLASAAAGCLSWFAYFWARRPQRHPRTPLRPSA